MEVLWAILALIWYIPTVGWALVVLAGWAAVLGAANLVVRARRPAA